MVVLLALTACLDPIQKDSGSDTGDTDDTGSGGGVDIFDIRSGEVADGETVTITGVLVSSPLTRADGESGRSDGFFVQDPAGGERSGVYVWSQGQFGDELDVEPGDEVTISGKISEYYGWTELVVGDATSITLSGSGTLPTPPDLGDGAGVDWDAWESVPVTLTNQTVESINGYSTGRLSAGVNLDDGFVYNDYACRGHYASVTGVVFYQYEEWSLNNRTAEDLGTYTAPEVVDTTIHAVRADGVCGPVRLTDVVATAQSFGEEDGRTYVFVQDAGGGEYSGLVAFSPAGFTAYAAGTTFEIVGDVSDYYGLVEVYVGDTGSLTATGTAEPVVTVVPDGITDWMPWQSALITVQTVTAVTDEDFGAVLTDKGVYVDDLLYGFDAQNGDSWASVTGPLYYTSYDDVPQFLVEPRSAADLVE